MTLLDRFEELAVEFDGFLSVRGVEALFLVSEGDSRALLFFSFSSAFDLFRELLVESEARLFILMTS